MAKPTVSETVDAQIKGQLIPNPNNGNLMHQLTIIVLTFYAVN